MHGYFIDNRLYQKAKSAANPFAHEEFVAKQIEKDIDEEAKRKPIKKKVNLYTVYRVSIEIWRRFHMQPVT